MNLQALTKPAPPHFHLWATTTPPHDALRELEHKTPLLAARVIRGAKSGTKAALLDEIGAVLQLATFGENWDALHDALCDPLLFPGPLVLGFAEAGFVLAAAPFDERRRLVAVLQAAILRRAQAKTVRPLHVLLQFPPDAASAVELRWRSAGAEMGRIQ
jgi:Barstar (barnase inhibitor)